ncbi:hypothetical protein GCM10007906_31630 [Vibrio hyugaensis]|uniref:HTH cro/C1-type domain-containing protein n=1 Tax=Vibrio hyugaensis TaxID=1534743 RepID=A0ABQ5Y3T5_9VIBR|nr:hypothetical protein [Vibrio hyugaensis]GLR05575.1 hypothetical protein GCM10007906_31630 [Vibrio hyugaensis]
MLKFHEFLKEVVFKKIPRKELIIKLHLEYDEFKGLDNITMSRWTNGVTKPSPRRQLIIAHATKCLNIFLNQCYAPKVPVSLESQYRKFLNQFNSHYHAIILNPELNSKVCHFKGSNSEAHEIYGDYTSKINITSSNLKNFDDYNKQYIVDVFYKGNVEKKLPESYMYFHQEIGVLFEILGLSAEEYAVKSDKDALFFGLSFFKNSDDYELLFGLVLNYVVRYHFSVKSAFFTARGREDMSLYETLGAEQLALIDSSKDYGNVYLYQIDLQKILSHPIFLGLIIKYSPIYDQKYEQIKDGGVEVERLFQEKETLLAM